MQLTLRPKTMLRSRTTLRALAVAAVAALVPLAACSPVGGGGAANQSSSDAGSATSGTVSWWGWTPTDVATAQGYIAAFNAEYPDIKVNFKLVAISDWQAALPPALRSDAGPDVFDMQPGAYVQNYKSFAEDLTPVMSKALGDDWQSKVAPAGVSGLTADGKLVAASVGAVYSGTVWYNPALFDKYGLQPPTTLDEWDKVCQAFKSHDQGCFVQGAAGEGFDQDTLQSIANSVEPGLWTKASKGEAPWNSPGLVKTFDIWHQLFSRNIMQPGAIGYQQYPDANNDFLTGKYAMVQMGTWYTQYTTDKAMTAALKAAGVSGAKPFPILPMKFPDVAQAGNPSTMFGDADYGLAVSTKAKNKAAAETFATWLATSTRTPTRPILKLTAPQLVQASESPKVVRRAEHREPTIGRSASAGPSPSDGLRCRELLANFRGRVVSSSLGVRTLETNSGYTDHDVAGLHSGLSDL